MTDITQPTIDRALTTIERERKYLESEREAFRILLRRLSDIQPDAEPNPTAGSGGGTTTVSMTSTAPAQSRNLREAREAYRETVMAVPHYESEYDDSLEENLTIECGPSLARRLIVSDDLTPATYSAFVNACKRAREERQRTLQLLKRERDSLQRFASALDAIGRDVIEQGTTIESVADTGTLSEIDDRLRALESQCEDLARDRQEQIHERSKTDVEGLELGFLEYLYGDLETMTPVLSDLTDCLETIHYYRLRCLR